MLPRLHRQGENAGITGSMVDALIRDRAGQAFWEAHKRAWEADSVLKARYGARAASMVLFDRRSRSTELSCPPARRSIGVFTTLSNCETAWEGHP
jgi:hypothetical protein